MTRKEHRDGAKLGTLSALGYEVSLEDHRLSVLKGETTVIARGIEHLVKGGRWSDSGLKSWLKGHGYRLEELTDTGVIYQAEVVHDDGTLASEDEVFRLLRMFLGSPDPQLTLEDAAETDDVGAFLAAIDDPRDRRPEWSWLDSTYHLQVDTYGYPLDEWAARVDTADNDLAPLNDVASYLDWNATAAVQEMAEVREEFAWKPWATDKPFVNRERVRDEVIDVLHFLGNILTAIGVTDDELANAYQEKQLRNRARQASGNYSAKKGGIGEGSDD
jgi:hypothetical protein